MEMTADLQRAEHADGFVEWSAGDPGAALSGRVLSYTGYREDMPMPVHRLEAANAAVSLIVSFGDAFRAQSTPGAAELSTYTSFAVGLHDRPAQTAHDGRQFGIQVRLDPLGAFSLFGVALHELHNRVVSADDLLGADADRWGERLSATRGWARRFALLDQLLAARMATGPVPSPELARAWRMMQRAGGNVRIAELAVVAGCSHRHLIGQFREQIGATPKSAARSLRFTRAARLISENLPLALVAATCGYADQAHLTREYATFAARTPGADVRLSLPANASVDLPGQFSSRRAGRASVRSRA